MGRRLDRGQSMMMRLARLLRDKRGATAVEYGLIAALVVMGAFLGIKTFANTSVGMWNNVSSTVAKS
jgi:pilus assembly protein Flp/PilA